MERYIAQYLIKTRQVAKKIYPKQTVTLQFFQRDDQVVLAGINESLKLLEENTKTTEYEIKYKKEGEVVNALDVVLQLKGHYHLFGHMEGIIDGIIARQSSIATNARRIILAAPKKRFVFMGDRADHYRNQAGDGYAAAVGGIKTQVTAAHVSLHNGDAVGTMPHALIALSKGDIVQALKAYEKTFPKAPLTALVDFNNDVISDALKALKAFKQNLAAVRVDTSQGVSDKMFANNKQKPRGVVPRQIKKLRKALDQNDGKHVQIIVSSGFDYKKIKRFEKARTPVDTYGIGASILKVWVNFTADIVQVNGKNIAKTGRGYKPIKQYETFKTHKKTKNIQK